MRKLIGTHFLSTLLLSIALILTGLAGVTPAWAANAADVCAGTNDLALVNGKIVTMDPQNSIASAVTIKNGRIADVGQGAQALGPCTQVINLQGRTVIPGLIDSHAHYLRAGLRPGHDVRTIETAFSIAELQAAISQRATSVPPGEFITAIGGWNTRQFAENRLPTLAELDAAAPNQPVYVQSGIAGNAVTNSLGKNFFVGKGIPVGDTGVLSAAAGFAALVAEQTFEDRKRATLDLMRHSNSLGLTTVIDPGGLFTPGAGLFDPFADYEPVLAVWREGKTTVRVRPFIPSNDAAIGDGSGSSGVEMRLRNAFKDFGDDMFRIAGLGEQIVTNSTSPVFLEATRLIAKRGWSLAQHTGTVGEEASHTATFAAVNAETPIAKLHWSLAHVFTITEAQLAILKQIGAGVTVQNQRYLSGSTPGAGPPFRRIVDSGIPVGAGTDATNVAPLNPWLSIFYMVTGKNNTGAVINAGQTLTRLEALRLYTIGSAWVSKDEGSLGSIEVGKLADLVVLSDDYLDPAKVSDEAIKRLSAVLTIVGGKVVFP